MRDELTALLDELRPRSDPQIQLDGKAAPPKRPSVAERSRIWDLAIKLGRELGSEVDPPPASEGNPDDPAAPARRIRRGRIDYGGA